MLYNVLEYILWMDIYVSLFAISNHDAINVFLCTSSGTCARVLLEYI